MGKMRAAAERVLPPRALTALLRLKDSAWYTAAGYLRAYLVLLLFIFGMLLIGFWALSVPYAILLAALIAALDFLPIIGVGTVLIPWGVVEIIRGNTFLGVGLLLLFTAITVARQFLEPKLIGHQLGMHPPACFGCHVRWSAPVWIFGAFAVTPRMSCPAAGFFCKNRGSE